MPHIGVYRHTKVTQILSAVLYAGKGMFATSTAFQFGSIAPFIFANTRDVQTSVDAVELVRVSLGRFFWGFGRAFFRGIFAP